MAATLLGVELDSSVLIAAERRKLTPAQAVESVQHNVGEVPIVLCALTIAEIGHGIYRAATEEMRSRRHSEVCFQLGHILASRHKIRFEPDQLVHRLILDQAGLPPFRAGFTDLQVFGKSSEAHSEAFPDLLQILCSEQPVLRAVNIRACNRIGIGLRVCHHVKSATVADHGLRADRGLLSPHPGSHVGNCGHHLTLGAFKALHSYFRSKRGG